MAISNSFPLNVTAFKISAPALSDRQIGAYARAINDARFYDEEGQGTPLARAIDRPADLTGAVSFAVDGDTAGASDPQEKVTGYVLGNRLIAQVQTGDGETTWWDCGPTPSI